MKVALGFWGLTRSLRYTMPSIQTHILDILKKNGINYTIFLHTYFVGTPYYNTHAGEYGIDLDNGEYVLLNADYIACDNQDEIKTRLDLTAYRTHPDPWRTEYQTVDNLVLAMYSKKQLGSLIKTTIDRGDVFDYVLFLRPDCQYVTDFDVNWFSGVTDTNILVPDFHCYSFKFNDRFALATPTNAIQYSKLFDIMLEYSRKLKLHSETTNYYYVTEILRLSVGYIPFRFNRVRANGIFYKDV